MRITHAVHSGCLCSPSDTCTSPPHSCLHSCSGCCRTELWSPTRRKRRRRRRVIIITAMILDAPLQLSQSGGTQEGEKAGCVCQNGAAPARLLQQPARPRRSSAMAGRLLPSVCFHASASLSPHQDDGRLLFRFSSFQLLWTQGRALACRSEETAGVSMPTGRSSTTQDFHTG